MLAVIEPNFEKGVGLLVNNGALSGNQIIFCQSNLLLISILVIFNCAFLESSNSFIVLYESGGASDRQIAHRSYRVR